MADHSTIILFPTLIVLLMSGHKVQGSVQDISFFKNTVGIVNRMAREGNITTHQKSAINNVVRILSEKTSQIVGGQTLEQIQRNFTAVERVSKKSCILLFLLCSKVSKFWLFCMSLIRQSDLSRVGSFQLICVCNPWSKIKLQLMDN